MKSKKRGTDFLYLFLFSIHGYTRRQDLPRRSKRGRIKKTRGFGGEFFVLRSEGVYRYAERAKTEKVNGIQIKRRKTEFSNLK